MSNDELIILVCLGVLAIAAIIHGTLDYLDDDDEDPRWWRK